jgi:uncharacterized hydrophobic protein (TIGR00271 family)
LTVNNGIARLFDLKQDQETPQAIDEQVRSGARISGTNLWVVFFAILVASVGLNVNSTAVIIGAMLISPLMGPIVAMGYGAAIDDTGLMARALKNLCIFTVLSLLTSTIYFTLSPLTEPGSELMARTTPNLWDVLIAAFGGAAGMVGATRRGFTNVVPGVAIATALMPPVCTAGFGLAHGRWDMFGGALFLFLINSVFIAASALAVSRLLRLPRVTALDAGTRLRTRLIIWVTLLGVLLPSVWLGWRLVQQEVFSGHARSVARALQAEPSSAVVAHSVDAAAGRLNLTVVGGAPAELAVQARAKALFAQRGVPKAEVVSRRVGALPDATELRRQIGGDVAMVVAQRLAELEAHVATLQAASSLPAAAALATAADVPALLAQLIEREPLVQGLSVVKGQRALAAGGDAQPVAQAVVDVRRPLSPSSRERLRAWLAGTLAAPELELVERVAAPKR